MIIRQEQMDVFSDYIVAEFEKTMVAHLRKLFPVETAGVTGEQLRALAHSGVERAERFGITDDSDVERFIEEMLLRGADFDANPASQWVREILCDDELTGAEKMDRISDHEVVESRESREWLELLTL